MIVFVVAQIENLKENQEKGKNRKRVERKK